MEEVASIAADYIAPVMYKTLTNKDLRFGMQIAGDVIGISVNSFANLSDRLCALEACQALISVLPLCKKIADSSYLTSLLVSMNPSEVELFIGILGVILKVFTSLEEEHSCAAFFQTLVKCGCIQKFFMFVTDASVAGADNMLCASIVILDVMHWLFSHDNSLLVSLQPEARHIAFQHRDSLFELSRHPVRKLSYLTTMLLIRLMLSEDKTTCRAIQVPFSFLDFSDFIF